MSVTAQGSLPTADGEKKIIAFSDHSATLITKEAKFRLHWDCSKALLCSGGFTSAYVVVSIFHGRVLSCCFM